MISRAPDRYMQQQHMQHIIRQGQPSIMVVYLYPNEPMLVNPHLSKFKRINCKPDAIPRSHDFMSHLMPMNVCCDSMRCCRANVSFGIRD
jgi:hypothetical protein